MADIHIDDAHVQEAVLRAAREMLANEESRLRKLSDGFIEDAMKARRDSLKEIDESRDRFEEKARIKLTEADQAVEDFNAKLAEKKKKVEDALNLKVIGGFSALMILATLGALALLGDRLLLVNTKSNEVMTAASALSTSTTALQTSITAANEVYKHVTDSAKGTDPASQLQTLNILTTRMDADLKKIESEIQLINTSLKPLQTDYAQRHPKKSP